MRLFDIFKKKPTPLSNNKLTLEQLIQKAATEPAFRTEFYKRLLTDELVVITQNSNSPQGTQTLEEGTFVNMVSFPDGKIPVFTSVDRIFDKGVVKEEVAYMKMKGEAIFDLAKGATFMLNPYSDYGKELLPKEIEGILNGTILTNAHQIITISKDTAIQIAQPAVYPTDIVNSLKKLFSERPEVKAAYVGWIFNPASEEPPHYIFALDGSGDLQNLTQEAGAIAENFLAPHEFVDFIKIEGNSSLNDYFLKQTQPFYKR